VEELDLVDIDFEEQMEEQHNGSLARDYPSNDLQVGGGQN
jgi:hypothetical protein